MRNPIRRVWTELSGKRTFYLMALPGLAYILIFNYFPMYGAILAFKSFNPSEGIWGSAWVGLQNFKFFFKSQTASVVTFNTVLYNLVCMAAITVLALLFAALANEVRGKLFVSVSKTIMLMPFFLSWVVASYILYSLLSSESGLINGIRVMLGAEPIQWYNEPSYWRVIMPLSYVWKQVGYYAVLYAAAITGISADYYEAAKIDGANRVQQFLSITLPLVTPVMITTLLLWCGKIFVGGLGDWGAFYNLPRNSGILLSTTNVIDTQVLRALRSVNDVGMASAIGLYQSAVGLVLVLFSNMLIKRVDPESALF